MADESTRDPSLAEAAGALGPDPENDPDAQALLARLGEVFMQAAAVIRTGDHARGAELLQLIVRREPRLPEPHLELARLHYDAGRLDDAEVSAREGLVHLQRGGRWLDALPEDVIASVAHGLLAEILRARLDTDAVVFGGEAAYRAMLADSKHHFQEARRLDPSNDHAGHHAFFLGLDDPLDEPADGEQS